VNDCNTTITLTGQNEIRGHDTAFGCLNHSLLTFSICALFASLWITGTSVGIGSAQSPCGRVRFVNGDYHIISPIGVLLSVIGHNRA
jgi:hypothetical protein